MPNKKEYTPEEIREYNERKQAEIDEMIQRINEGVNAVFETDKYKEYLKFAAQFTDYSARNTMLTACVNGLNVEEYFYRLLTSDRPVMPW